LRARKQERYSHGVTNRDDLLDEFLKEPPKLCKIGHIATQLDAERQAKLTAALQDHRITSARIAQVLRRWGHPVANSSVRIHRKGECRCNQT